MNIKKFCVLWKWFLSFWHVILFLLLHDNKNILNNVKNKKLVMHKKQFCVKKTIDVAQKVICCPQKQFDAARKIVSCQQKQEYVSINYEKITANQRLIYWLWWYNHHEHQVRLKCKGWITYRFSYYCVIMTQRAWTPFPPSAIWVIPRFLTKSIVFQKKFEYL